MFAQSTLLSVIVPLLYLQHFMVFMPSRPPLILFSRNSCIQSSLCTLLSSNSFLKAHFFLLRRSLISLVILLLAKLRTIFTGATISMQKKGSLSRSVRSPQCSLHVVPAAHCSSWTQSSLSESLQLQITTWRSTLSCVAFEPKACTEAVGRPWLWSDFPSRSRGVVLNASLTLAYRRSITLFWWGSLHTDKT